MPVVGLTCWGASASSEGLTVFLAFSSPSRKMAGGHPLLRDWSGKSLISKVSSSMQEAVQLFLTQVNI